MDIKLHKQATTIPKIRAEIEAAPASRVKSRIRVPWLVDRLKCSQQITLIGTFHTHGMQNANRMEPYSTIA